MDIPVLLLQSDDHEIMKTINRVYARIIIMEV